MAGVAVERQGVYTTGLDRLTTLARPKESKQIWITSNGPKVMWGTQEVLWPITSAAKQANPSDRLVELSKSKNIFQTGHKVNRPEFIYSCGRSSMVWDVSPLAAGSGSECSERIAQLAAAKQPPTQFSPDRPLFMYSCGRVTPIWSTADAAKQSSERPRTESLARHKMPHMSFTGAREIETIIPRPALSAKASERLESLAVPKRRPDGPFRDALWPVSPTAKNSQPSNRCLELSKAKGCADGYLPLREVETRVSRAATRAIPSARVNDLSRPIVRASMDHVQFDPEAFKVKDNALKARCTPRTEELAQPITR